MIMNYQTRKPYFQTFNISCRGVAYGAACGVGYYILLERQLHLAGCWQVDSWLEESKKTHFSTINSCTYMHASRSNIREIKKVNVCDHEHSLEQKGCGHM